MESNNYYLFNQNPRDINVENKDDEAPPSIIQSQIDINSQHSELSNSNSNSNKDINIELDVDIKSYSGEKEDNSSISFPEDANLEEKEADAPEIAGIVSQHEIKIELNNINQDIGENNNIVNFPCPEPKKADNLLNNERPKDSELKEKSSDDYYNKKSFDSSYFYYDNNRFKFSYNPYFSYFPFGPQYFSYESYFNYGFNYSFRHHFPFGRFSGEYI